MWLGRLRLIHGLAARHRMMSSFRPVYLRGGSNEANLSEEVRDLIKNKRTIDNIDEWKRGYGIGEPIKYSMKDPQDIDCDQVSQGGVEYSGFSQGL